MSFITFKLDHPPERSTPVPIAAAGPRAPSKWQDGSAARRKIACISCQISKARCEPPFSGSDKCRRCLRLQMECTVHLSKDSALPVNKTLPSYETHPYPEIYSKAGLGDVTSSSDKQASVFFSEGFAEVHLHQQSLSDSQKRDIDQKIDSIFSMKTAEHVFHHYVSSFAPKCPIVAFPPGTTAAHVRQNKPLLFLSILGIASVGHCSAAEQRQLAVDVRSYLADRAIVRGEKSLEFVQALQITSLWYRAPDEYRQMNLNQLAHIATTMAIDLGLDRADVLQPAATAQDNWDRAEAHRAWLGCFLLSESLSIILRRPNPITWTAKLDDYLADLQQTKAADTDGFLCKLIATERLCHDIDQELFLSDPVRSVPAWDPKTLAIIEAFQARNDWTFSDHTPLQISLIRFSKFASLLYSHEVALHVNHNIEEFKAPFSAKSLKTYNFLSANGPNKPPLSMLRNIVIASHGLLDTFLGLSVPDMLTLPPHIYGGRVIYAVIILLKIHTAIMSPGTGAENVLRPEELRLEVYLERLAVVSKLLLTKDERSSLSRAFLIIAQLKDWFYRRLRPSGTDRELPIESAQSSSATQVSTASISDFSIAMPSTGETSLPGCVTPQDRLDYQFDDVIQPIVPPASRGSNPTVASDTWFSEFFNVEMLS